VLIAQQLYEGIKVKDNITGFITYPRTDSIRLSEKFVQDAFDYIQITYGEEYLGHSEEEVGRHGRCPLLP